MGQLDWTWSKCDPFQFRPYVGYAVVELAYLNAINTGEYEVG